QKERFPANMWTFSISPDGKHMSGPSEFGYATLWEIDGGKKLASFEDTFGAAFSPDGSTLALSRKGVVEFRDATGKERRSILRLTGEHHNTTDLRFSPDGHRAVVRIEYMPKPNSPEPI